METGNSRQNPVRTLPTEATLILEYPYEALEPRFPGFFWFIGVIPPMRHLNPLKRHTERNSPIVILTYRCLIGEVLIL